MRNILVTPYTYKLHGWMDVKDFTEMNEILRMKLLEINSKMTSTIQCYHTELKSLIGRTVCAS